MLCNNLVTLRGVEIKQSVDQGSIAQRIYSLSAGLPRSSGVEEGLHPDILPYNHRPILAQRGSVIPVLPLTPDYKSCLVGHLHLPKKIPSPEIRGRAEPAPCEGASRRKYIPYLLTRRGEWGKSGRAQIFTRSFPCKNRLSLDQR